MCVISKYYHLKCVRMYVIHAMKSKLHREGHIYQTIKILQSTKQNTADDHDSSLQQKKGCTMTCKTHTAPRALHTPFTHPHRILSIPSIQCTDIQLCDTVTPTTLSLYQNGSGGRT